MRKLQRSLLASAITLSLAASAHADTQFSNVYFFGDSLTDAGNYKAVLPPGTGSSRRIRVRCGRPCSRDISA